MRILAAVALLLVSTTEVAAQEHPKIVLINELLEASGAHSSLDKLRIENVAGVRRAMLAQAGNQNDNPIYKRVFDRVMSKYDDYSKEIFDWSKLEPEYVTLYDQLFTEDEIRGILEFYRTDAGKASLRAMPIILTKMQQRMADKSAEVSARINRILKDSVSEVQAEVAKEQANQSSDPTPMSVTPVAAQPARQP
jgi:uncharacterized protein